jgi:endonuclease G
MALLDNNEINEVITAMTKSGVDLFANRGALFQSVDYSQLGVLPRNNLPVAQLMTDIGQMNMTERLTSGEIPLQIYLQNALFLLAGAPQQQQVIRVMLDRVIQRASGAPIPDITGIPETKEKIIFTDDMVSFAFMEGGLAAAAAVMKLKVPSYERGQPRQLPNGAAMNFLGTGWLLTESLVMTNHHVINARKDGESVATEADLRLQVAGTQAQLDFDGDLLEGSWIRATMLEAWDVRLDYAVLRIPATGRTPLRVAAQPLLPGTEHVPVNIIQHPGGRSKRYGIRNNLVSGSTATDLRYFTDTEGGSSGSPVFNDQWQVVALHRASVNVSNVSYQGKTSAYVNMGTHLSVVMEDIRNRYQALAAEIGPD